MTVNHHIHAVKGLYTNVMDNSQVKILSHFDLNNPNNWFELTYPDKKTHPFMDIDNHDDYKGDKLEKIFTEEEFNTLCLKIEKILINTFPTFTVLNACKYKSKKYDKNGNMVKIENKISFRLTDPQHYCRNMNTTKEYCMKHLAKKAKECLGDYSKYIDVDSSVYRNGKGKMSCVNSYKYPQEKDRIRALVHGEIEETYIQTMLGNEIEIIPEKPIEKPTPKETPGDTTPLDIFKKDEAKGQVPEKEQNKFWDYALLIDKQELGNREKWIHFTYCHINILGINDYENYNNFLKDTTNYHEYENKIKYEELYNDKDKTQQKLGWKYLYTLAYDNNKEKKLKLDNHYRKPFDIKYMLSLKPKEENLDIQKQINELQDNEDIKTSVKIRKIKELENQLKEHKKQQEDLKYKAMKSYFELYHIKLVSPFCYIKIIDNDDCIMRYNKNSFRDYCDNIEISSGVPFTSKWFKDSNIKTYEFIDFIPTGVNCPKNTLNMFRGLEIEKVRTTKTHSYEYILDLIRLNAGDNNDMYDWFIKYLAHLVQKPGILPGIAVIIIGEQGTGKSTLWEQFGNKVLGQKYALQSSNADDIIGKFNLNKNKLLVVMEETEAKNTFENCSQIKTLITQPTKYYENKGKDKFKVRNCGRYVFISNNQTPVKIEHSDRRFIVSECSSRCIQNKEFFKKVNEEWNDPKAVRGFYDFLMEQDIENFDPARDRVITDVYEDMKSITIPTMARWLEEKCYSHNKILSTENPQHASLLRTRKASELFKSYKKWIEKSGFKTEGVNTTRFGRDIKKYVGIEYKRTKHGVMYSLDYKNILDGLISRGYTKEITDHNDYNMDDDEYDSD